MIEKFRGKYGAKDVKKYYSKFDVAVCRRRRKTEPLGAWCCHTGCGNGGILEFERKFSGCDNDAAMKNIADIVGQPYCYLSPFSTRYSTRSLLWVARTIRYLAVPGSLVKLLNVLDRGEV